MVSLPCYVIVLLAIVLTGKARPQNPECPKTCPNLWSPVCGSDGETYANKCQLDMVAGCWGENVVLKSVGRCPECPDGVPIVNCFADPCLSSSCPSHPEAKCRSNYCGGCNAVWYGEDGNVVNCA